MNRVQKFGIIFVALMFLGLSVHELRHFYRYGHFVPFGMHADVSVTSSDNILGVDGPAKIYRATLTNYGVIPTSIVVCEYLVSGAPGTDVSYVVERWDRQLRKWTSVPEWDFGGYRLFCRPIFEVTQQHLANRRLWPGQSIEIGEGIPAQLGGFQIGDDGRFTTFLSADDKLSNAVSTAVFRIDQQPKNIRAP